MSPKYRRAAAALALASAVLAPAALRAQFDFSGSCLDATVTVDVDPGQPTFNGKPFYIGTGDFTEPGQPTETLNFEVYWEVSVVPNAWVFANGGFIIAENDADTPTPPLSSASAWTILTGGPETCPANDLVVTATGPVPVRLAGLSVKREGAAAVLTWQTATERDNVGFAVERGGPSIHWTGVGFVAGAGTSSELLDYRFADAAAPASVVYYRLRQMDADGTEALSDVIVLGAVAAGSLAVRPNPSAGAATLSGLAPGEHVTVYDALGRRVYAATATGEWHDLTKQHLPEGAYVAVATDARGATRHVSFTIQ